MTKAPPHSGIVSCGVCSGKAILLGEHFVVHGTPALAMPLRSSVGTIVSALGLPADSPSRAVQRDPCGALPTAVRAGGDESSVDHESPTAPRGLSLVVTLNWAGHAGADRPSDMPHGHVATCLALCRDAMGGPPLDQVTVQVASTIPRSAGLGSSAALALAAARAWCGLTLVDNPKMEVRAVANAAEAIAHGNPSGIDVATLLATGPLRFRRQQETFPIRVAEGIGVVLLDTGAPGQTVATVARVGAFRAAHYARFVAASQAVAELVAQAEHALATGDAWALGAAMTANQTFLEEVGVSSPALEATIRAALACGCTGAKLTGGGGGGCVIAVVPVASLDAVTVRLGAASVDVIAAFPLAGLEPCAA